MRSVKNPVTKIWNYCHRPHTQRLPFHQSELIFALGYLQIVKKERHFCVLREMSYTFLKKRNKDIFDVM